jgi:2-iminoacetate synthase
MYISNYCTNVCPYCSFAKHHDIIRSHLSIDAIRQEAKRISDNGIRHILVLTGESPLMVPVSYLEKAIVEIKKHFTSVTIEIYPLTENEYSRLLSAGADALTLYQETYAEHHYRLLHPTGPKADYQFRLDAPERACCAGMRSVTVGALYGLYHWRTDAFFAGLHAAYLQNKFPAVEVGISFPRLRPLAGTYTTHYPISDHHLVQMLASLRLLIPSAGITMSTRESAVFRMNVLPLGVTKMSAGVSTSVGGHSGNESTPQFEIADDRDVPTICKDLLTAGYQPVLHDWNYELIR